MSSSPKSSLQTQQLQPFIDSSLSDSNSILGSNNLSCNISKTVSCGHLLEIRSKLGSNPFSNLKDYLKLRPLGRASIRRDPVLEVAQCGACDRPRSRLYACLACATVSCHLHASSHAADAKDDGGCSLHSIAVDIDRAELFCCVCKDQVYDCNFDVAVVVALAQSAASTIGPIPDPLPESMPKRRRVEYKPWTPDLKEQALPLE